MTSNQENKIARKRKRQYILNLFKFCETAAKFVDNTFAFINYLYKKKIFLMGNV